MPGASATVIAAAVASAEERFLAYEGQERGSGLGERDVEEGEKYCLLDEEWIRPYCYCRQRGWGGGLSV